MDFKKALMCVSLTFVLFSHAENANSPLEIQNVIDYLAARTKRAPMIVALKLVELDVPEAYEWLKEQKDLRDFIKSLIAQGYADWIVRVLQRRAYRAGDFELEKLLEGITLYHIGRTGEFSGYIGSHS